jgi:predicted HTH transcriptional regulator
MPTHDPRLLLRRLLQEAGETDWLEFKHNNCTADDVGRYVSALANAAMLRGCQRAFIVWGIDDKTKERVGTSVRLRLVKKGGENLENWLNHMIEPRIVLELMDFEDEGQAFSIISIDPGYDRPIRCAGVEYIRIGE